MALRTPLSVTPHLYMGDSTGRPLDMGTVYFGEQDKDPEFYPINLFSDDALTKPLAQPVHTKGGYLYDKGDMVEPHAKEIIYSVKVLDSYGRKVFYKGAMMRNSWNDDVIEQINEALVSTAEEAAQIATDVAKEIADKAVASSGFVTIDSFELGATITQRNQALRHAADGKLYRWAGDLPKVVPASSTPTSSGGMGDNAWLEVSDVTLRQDLASPDKGMAMVARGVVAVDSIADLLALPNGQRKEGLRYLVASYHDGWAIEIPYRGPSGGGEFRWNPARTDENDGGIILNGFERIVIDGYIEPEMFGGRTSVELQKSVDFGEKVRWRGDYEALTPVTVPNTVRNLDAEADIHVGFSNLSSASLNPVLIFPEFSGVAEGRIRIVNLGGGALSSIDGAQFIDSDGFAAGDFKFSGVRFGLLLTACSNFKTGDIFGENIRGYQGSADNGGSLLSVTSSKRGSVGNLIGVNVYKAAMYFSIDGSGVDNKDVTVGDVNVSLAESSVANAVGVRSAVNCRVGDIHATGGISSLYITQNVEGYNVDNFTTGRVTKDGVSVASSTSNAVRVVSTVSYPVGRVTLESLDSKGSNQPSLFLSNCSTVEIKGKFIAREGNARAIQFAGDIEYLSISEMESRNQGSTLVIHTAGVIGRLKIGVLTFSGYTLTSAPFPLDTVGSFKRLDIGLVIDKNETPTFSRIFILGDQPASTDIRIGRIETSLSGPVTLRGAVINRVDGYFFTGSSPVSPVLWPVGQALRKFPPAAGGPVGWVNTGSEWLSYGEATA